MDNAKRIQAVLIGLGHRTLLYGSYALEHPDELAIVGLADPDTGCLQRAAAMFDIPTAEALTNLEQAITQWATARVGPDRALTLYVMDHGRYDGLYLDGKAEVLDPQSLDGWLNELEQAVPGVWVNVLLEACYSGSFIDPAQRVSRGERLVIASTSAQGGSSPVRPCRPRRTGRRTSCAPRCITGSAIRAISGRRRRMIGRGHTGALLLQR